MKKKVLSVFVDESGRFVHPDGDSRFYIIGFVLHDQGVVLDEHIQRLEQSWFDLGLTKEHCFHAGPLIRREQCYEALNREFRIRIFSRMMSFARKVDFQYRCVMVDKKFVDSIHFGPVAGLRQSTWDGKCAPLSCMRDGLHGG